MPRVTHTVTLPDGTVATRTSDRRRYAWVVALGPMDPATHAARLRREAGEALQKARLIEAALASPITKLVDRGLGRAFWLKDGEPDYYSHELHLVVPGCADAHVYVRCTRDRVSESYPDRTPVPAAEELEAAAKRQVESLVGFASDKLRTAEAVDAGTANLAGWGVYRWSSRRDLAEAYANGADVAWHVQDGRTVHVLPVDGGDA